MRKLLLLAFGVMVALPALSQEGFFRGSKLQEIQIPITNGLTYKWTVTDQKDTVRYFNPNGKKFKATITFEEIGVVIPPILGVKVEAESFVSKVNAEVSGTFIRPTSGWLPWSVNYNVTLAGQDKVSFTYYNGNTGDCIVTMMSGAATLGTFKLPTSGGWGNARTEIFNMPAQTGVKAITLSFQIGINFDYFVFSK